MNFEDGKGQLRSTGKNFRKWEQRTGGEKIKANEEIESDSGDVLDLQAILEKETAELEASANIPQSKQEVVQEKKQTGEDPIKKLGVFMENSMTEGTLKKAEDSGAVTSENISSREKDLIERMSRDSFADIFNIDLIEKDNWEARRLFGLAKGKTGFLTKMLSEFQQSIKDVPGLSNEDVESKMKAFYCKRMSDFAIPEKIKKVIEKACGMELKENLSGKVAGKQEKESKKEAITSLTDSLKGKILEKANEDGIMNVLGMPILNADAYTMASIAGKNIIEDENILNETMEGRRIDKDFSFSDACKKRISDTIADADLNKLVFDVFIINQIEREIKLAKNAFAAGKLYQRKMKEISKESEKNLIQSILLEIKSDGKAEKDFLSIRRKDPKATLKWVHQNNIKSIANKKVDEALFVDEPIGIQINFPGKNDASVAPFVDLSPTPKDDIITAVEDAVPENEIVETDAVTETGVETVTGAETEVKVENKFEIPKEKREIFEEDLIHAIHEIVEVAGDELDIDFIPAEKRFSGNLKDKMELLLNRGGFIDEKTKKEEAEGYWKELEKLDEMAKEIVALEKKDMICVAHEGNTYFIKKEQEIVISELEKVTKKVVSEKYLSSFIFGIKKDYDKYASELRDHDRWNGLSEIKKRELLEKGIVVLVDEILRANKIVVENGVKEKMNKYAFAILNKNK